MIVYTAPCPEIHEDADGIYVSIYDDTGTETTSFVLEQGFSYKIAVAVADNGQIGIVYKPDGPDSVVYAVLDEEGTVIAGPENLDNVDPRSVGCTVWPDGDFTFMFQQDRSRTITMFNATNEGVLLPHKMYIGTEPGNGDYTLTLVPISEREQGIIYEHYSDEYGGSFQKFCKGYLAIEEVSSTEARLYNYTNSHVTVTLSVAGE